MDSYCQSIGMLSRMSERGFPVMALMILTSGDIEDYPACR